MSPARRAGLLICNSLFRFMLLATVSLVVFQLCFRTPKLIKVALVSTKAYERFVPAVIAANAKNQQANSLPLNDPKVQEIANKDFSPQLLQSNTEQFIDATYAWLEGKTYQPRFRLNFNDAKQQFANDLGVYAVQRLEALPVCKTYDPRVALDPFHATCRPKGLQLEGQDQEIAAAITGSQQFLPKTVFTADDLPKNAEGATITQQLALAPLAFRMSYSLMWISAGLTLLLGAGMVYLRPSRWVGWRSLGFAVLSDGAFLAISTLIFGRILPNETRALQSQLTSGNGTEVIMNDAVQHVSDAVQTLFINIGIQLAAFGVVIIALERILRPNRPFANLEKLAGLISGIRSADREKVRLVAAEVPLQSSEMGGLISVEEEDIDSSKLAEIEEEIA